MLNLKKIAKELVVEHHCIFRMHGLPEIILISGVKLLVMAANQGLSVEFSTFERYTKNDIIGHKKVERNGKTFVNFVWCKLCVKHKHIIILNPCCKGSAHTGLKVFVSIL